MTSARADVEVLEREQARLEGLLAHDANWRMLQDLVHNRSIEQFAAVPDRAGLMRSLETVLSTNRYYLARRKIVEAIELLSAGAPPAITTSASHEDEVDIRAPSSSPAIAAALSRAQRAGIAERMVMIEPTPASADAMEPARPLADFKVQQPSIRDRAAAWPPDAAIDTIAARDQFELLSGMDAATITALQEAGINRFAAIAAWTAGDVARYRRTLTGGENISSEGWIEQAAVLATGRDTAYARRVKRGGQAIILARPASHEGEPVDRKGLFERMTLASLPARAPRPGILTSTAATDDIAQKPERATPVALTVAAAVRSGASAEVRSSDALRTSPDRGTASDAEPFLILADHDAIRLDGAADAAKAAPPPANTLQNQAFAPLGKKPEPASLVDVVLSPPADAKPAAAARATIGDAQAFAHWHTPAPKPPVLLPPLPAIASTLDEPAATAAAAERSVLDRLARLEQNADALGNPDTSLRSRLEKAVAATTGRRQFDIPPLAEPEPSMPRPARAERPLQYIEDEEFPELSVDEADVVIVASRKAETASPSVGRSTHDLIKRHRKAEEKPVEARTYAGYQIEVEEAAVEIVRRAPPPMSDALPSPADADPIAGGRGSKGSVQRFLKSLGNK